MVSIVQKRTSNVPNNKKRRLDEIEGKNLEMFDRRGHVTRVPKLKNGNVSRIHINVSRTLLRQIDEYAQRRHLSREKACSEIVYGFFQNQNITQANLIAERLSELTKAIQQMTIADNQLRLSASQVLNMFILGTDIDDTWKEDDQE